MTRSESIGELAKALCKAQGAMLFAKKDSANPFFKSKYADLASVVEAAKKPLAENGLSYIQMPRADAAGVTVETLLMHISGEWIASDLFMVPTKADPQGVGSTITYIRRYALQAMLGIPAEDDDGNAASGNVGKATVTAWDKTEKNQNGTSKAFSESHAPIAGAWERMTPSQQEHLESVAIELALNLSLKTAESEQKALDKYNEITEMDEKLALWSRLDSKVRSRLKILGEAQRKADIPLAQQA